MQSNLVSCEPVTCEVQYMTTTKKEERNGNTDVCMNQSYDRQGHKERVLLKPNQQTGISGSPGNTGFSKNRRNSLKVYQSRTGKCFILISNHRYVMT